MDPSPAAATRPRPTPDWLPRVLGQLEAMRKVPDNWDGYQADAPRPEMIDTAIRFIRSLADRLRVGRPYVTPTRTGGVLFAWERDAHQLEVDFDPEEGASFLYLNKDTDESATGAIEPTGGNSDLEARLIIFLD